MRIWVKPDQLAKLDITVPEIIDAVETQNTVNPAGTIGGEPIPERAGIHLFGARPGTACRRAEEFGNIVLRANPDGSMVRLRDVARIELGAQNYTLTAASTANLPRSSRFTSYPAQTRSRPPTARKR